MSGKGFIEPRHSVIMLSVEEVYYGILHVQAAYFMHRTKKRLLGISFSVYSRCTLGNRIAQNYAIVYYSTKPVGLMAMLILYLQANRIQRIHELIRLLYIYMRRMKLYAALFTQALGEVKSKGGSAHRVGN